LYSERCVEERNVDMPDGNEAWRQSGCVLLIWPEFVGPPDGGLLDLQLNEIYDFVTSRPKMGFTGF